MKTESFTNNHSKFSTLARAGHNEKDVVIIILILPGAL